MKGLHPESLLQKQVNVLDYGKLPQLCLTYHSGLLRFNVLLNLSVLNNIGRIFRGGNFTIYCPNNFLGHTNTGGGKKPKVGFEIRVNRVFWPKI